MIILIVKHLLRSRDQTLPLSWRRLVKKMMILRIFMIVRYTFMSLMFIGFCEIFWSPAVFKICVYHHLLLLSELWSQVKWTKRRCCLMIIIKGPFRKSICILQLHPPPPSIKMILEGTG